MNLKMQDKKNTKGIQHLPYSDNFEVFEASFVGMILGYAKHNCITGKTTFSNVGMLHGAIIGAVSAIIGTRFEALVGMIMYHNEGALIGSFAGVSLEASLGAAVGIIGTRKFDGVLCGTIIGYGINGIRYLYEEVDFYELKEFVHNKVLGPHLRAQQEYNITNEFIGENNYTYLGEYDNKTTS